jgi:hypothetical protein
VSAQKNFGNGAQSAPAGAAARAQLDRKALQARELATIDTHEMGMRRRSMVVGVRQLEPTDLVAKIESGYQPRLCQFVEATEKGRLVESRVSQGFDDIGMA